MVGAARVARGGGGPAQPAAALLLLALPGPEAGELGVPHLHELGQDAVVPAKA